MKYGEYGGFLKETSLKYKIFLVNARFANLTKTIENSHFTLGASWHIKIANNG